MTLNELLTDSYRWADGNADLILLASVGVPLLGTLLASVGKGGKTDADGRFIASAVMASAICAVLAEVVFLFIARSQYGVGLLEANPLLLIAPVLCLGGSIFGIRRVFPLNELGSVRVVADMGLLLLILAGVLWLFSRFRGWGILFVGTFTQLLLVSAIALFFVWRLWRRVWGAQSRSVLASK
ncbi:MAG: hypothetical protein M3Y59_14490 [Myxococcota bacterium]|nr:hypothetical protein [Myxococcota bacterium]